MELTLTALVISLQLLTSQLTALASTSEAVFASTTPIIATTTLKMPATEIEQAILRYFPDVFDEAVAVANCESGLNHTVNGRIVRGPDGKDLGLFQIRSSVWEGKARSLGLNIY